MDEEEISYRILRKIQQMEKNSPALTELKSDFYYALSEYLKNLNNRFERETSSQKKMLMLWTSSKFKEDLNMTGSSMVMLIMMVK